MELVKIKKIGGSLFVRIPKKFIKDLDLKADDILIIFKLAKNTLTLEKREVKPRSLARYARSLAR